VVTVPFVPDLPDVASHCTGDQQTSQDDQEVFRRINSDDEPASGEQPLSMLVVKLFIDRFAWHAKIEWRADVVLDFLDEDAAVEAIAEFLWRNRHTLPKQ